MSVFDAVADALVLCRACKRPADISVTSHVRGVSARGEQLVERVGCDQHETHLCVACMIKSGEHWETFGD